MPHAGLIGPLPPSRRGKVYQLVMQDCNTKWVETAPVPNKSAPVVAEGVGQHVDGPVRGPTDITQHNGCEFTADVFMELHIPVSINI
jgi:hypothetical protein